MNTTNLKFTFSLTNPQPRLLTFVRLDLRLTRFELDKKHKLEGFDDLCGLLMIL